MRGLIVVSLLDARGIARIGGRLDERGDRGPVGIELHGRGLLVEVDLHLQTPGCLSSAFFTPMGHTGQLMFCTSARQSAACLQRRG